MSYIDPYDLPDFQTVEDAIHFLTSRKENYCPEKMRLFFLEGEGTKFVYGPDAGQPHSIKYKMRKIIQCGLCYNDAHFLTGWIERDGTCRSNDYGHHDTHLSLLDTESSIVERRGWIHVSTYICTPSFRPSAAQEREMKRIGKWYREDRAGATRRFVPLKADVPIKEQLAILYSNV